MPEILTITGLGWGIAAFAAWAVEGSNSSWWIHPPPPAPPSWNGDTLAEYECRWWTLSDGCVAHDKSYGVHKRTEPTSEMWNHARYCAMKNDTGCILSHEIDRSASYGFFVYDPTIADLRFYSQPELHTLDDERVEVQIYEPTHASRPSSHELYYQLRIEHLDTQSPRILRTQATGELAYCAQLLNISTCTSLE